MDIRKIHSAFFPSSEIMDPEFFVGRKSEIQHAMLGLQEQGAFLSFYGLRGVGKSSLTQQFRQIAEGNERLPKILNLEKFLPKRGFNYLTHYVSCDTSVKNVDDLVKRIMFGDNNTPSLFSHTHQGDRSLKQTKEVLKLGGGVNILGVKLEGAGTEENVFAPRLSDDLIQQFKSLLGSIEAQNRRKEGLLIIIDEFDVLKFKEGFGSLVKTCSNNFIKFAITGIANSITELIVDHSSVGRQLHAIEIEKMPKEEMYGILSRAEHQISYEIVFTELAKHAIIEQSEGFPYFVHLIGKQAFIDAYGNEQSKIDDKDIKLINDKICRGRLTTIYENIYHDAVANSRDKELLLKLLADEESDEIYLPPVIECAENLGVNNPTELLVELNIDFTKKGMLTAVRTDYYRFLDPVAKVYTRIRNWEFI